MEIIDNISGPRMDLPQKSDGTKVTQVLLKGIMHLDWSYIFS